VLPTQLLRALLKYGKAMGSNPITSPRTRTTTTANKEARKQKPQKKKRNKKQLPTPVEANVGDTDACDFP